MMHEHMDKVVEQSKVEIEAYLERRLQQIPQLAAGQNAPKLLAEARP